MHESRLALFLIFVFLLCPSPLFAAEFGWDVRLNNYTGGELVESGKRIHDNTDFFRLRTLLVRSGEGLKTTTLRFTDPGGKERCRVAITTRGFKDDARLLSADPEPESTCKVDYTPGPHKAPMIKGMHIDQQPTPRIVISVLNAPEDNSKGLDIKSLYCDRDGLETLAPNIERIRFIERAGRTSYYRIVLKGGTKADYDTLEENAWNRCMRSTPYWFIARDPDGFFVSTIPPDWRLRGRLDETQRLRFEKPGTGKSPFDAAITVRLLPSGAKTGDNPDTLDDGIYTVQTRHGILLIQYEAPKEQFSANRGAYELFIEGLKLEN